MPVLYMTLKSMFPSPLEVMSIPGEAPGGVPSCLADGVVKRVGYA